MNINDYVGTYIYCVKEVYTLKLYHSYKVVGVGDLEMMYDSKKVGYGFSILQEFYDGNNYRNTFHYFTENEFSEYFTDHDNYLKIKNRNNKLRKLGIDE